MDFNLPEDLVLLQQTVRKFADDEVAPHARQRPSALAGEQGPRPAPHRLDVHLEQPGRPDGVNLAFTLAHG